jgi:hypothetical protein
VSWYRVRPLSDRSWLRPEKDRAPSPFRSSWPDTEKLLAAEVTALDGQDVVIGIDVGESDLRLDGGLRALARAATPAVEVAFTSKHGPLRYRSDRYTTQSAHQGEPWHANGRAIALTLQALRAVDRYGASGAGEQYTGYRAIAAAPAPMTRGQARFVVWSTSAVGDPALDLDPPPAVVRRALRRAHPDVAGDRAAWDRLEEAVRVLEGPA